MAPITAHKRGLIVPQYSPLTLGRILEWMAQFSTSHHRDLMRGMVSELDSIADPAERRRFAIGAFAAIIRLALSGYRRAVGRASGRFVIISQPKDANSGGTSMPKLSMGKLLRRYTTSFTVILASLTAFVLADNAIHKLPKLRARGVSVGTPIEVLLLAMPYILAMTVPMAAFLAGSWVFTRLGAEGVLSSAQQERHGVRRLLTPVLGAAAVIAALMVVFNGQVLPRANARLVAVLAGTPQKESDDRTMTIGELREAARSARTGSGQAAAVRGAAYEVEIQKKFSLAFACVVLTLAGAALAFRFPRGGVGLVIGASSIVFTGYYLSLMIGESLADRQVISPFVAMWMANAFLLAVVLLLVWRRGQSGAHGAGSIVIGE